MKSVLKSHIEKLGMEGKDKVTGFKGVISSLSLDLYGCVQVVLTPKITKDGKIADGHWFDITRVEVTGKNPVMEVPNYETGNVAEGKKGSSIKTVPKI